jgi:hypothetical protein
MAQSNLGFLQQVGERTLSESPDLHREGLSQDLVATAQDEPQALRRAGT